MPFPVERPRRLRRTAALRRMVKETRVCVDQLVEPFFVVPGGGIKNPIPSMPGIFQTSVDVLVEEVRESAGYGIPAVILFGIPERKDETGTSAWDESGVVPRAVRALKRALPDLCVMTDVCLCEYTDHGHCGILEEHRGVKDVANDATLEALAKEALAHAKAGADVVAPSDMMDGRVGRIRRALDEAGHAEVAILSYAAKYASAFYGPFREAAQSAPAFGDRKSYQMDPANAREALREVALDIAEGADAVMVKPALSYLDVIRSVRDRFDVPLAAYNVSGEYAMLKAAAANGWIDGPRAAMEVVTSIVRAGADIVLTYHAREIAKALL